MGDGEEREDCGGEVKDYATAKWHYRDIEGEGNMPVAL